MNLSCPECSTVYRIDPEKVPASGAVTRCRQCDTRFHVQALDGQAPGEVTVAERATTGVSSTGGTEPASGGATAPTAAPAFGPQDPDTRAKRLARALVSDIKVYHPDKWERSREEGSLRAEFRDEILKSWDEYVEQVGERMAKKTPYFREALNDILAGGERVF